MKQTITVYTLAEELGVSVSAISRAFNPKAPLKPEKREMILAAAAKYGFTPNRAAARLSRRTLHIGVVIVNRVPEFYQQMLAGVQSGAEQLSAQKVAVDIRTLVPEEGIVNHLLQLLDEFQASGYDGVIVHGVYDPGIACKIDELVDAGIPVVTLHNDLPSSRRLFTSTCDTAMTGGIAAELLRAFLPGPQRSVVLFTGSMSSPIHQQLMMSFSAHCVQEGLRLLDSYDTMDVADYAARLIAQAFQEHPDINGIYVSSATSIPICQYLKEHDLAGKVALITSDTFPRLNEFIRQGVANASIDQDPFRIGRNALTSLSAFLTDGQEPPQVLVSHPRIVIRSNLGLFEK